MKAKDTNQEFGDGIRIIIGITTGTQTIGTIIIGITMIGTIIMTGKIIMDGPTMITQADGAIMTDTVIEMLVVNGRGLHHIAAWYIFNNICFHSDI